MPGLHFSKFFCVYFCLKLLVSPTNSSCICIRVRDCPPFVNLLLNHKPEVAADVFAVVRSAACGFQGLDLKACCPIQSYTYQRGKPTSLPERFERFAHEEPWIWEYKSKGRQHFNRFSTTPFGPNSIEENNLHDFRVVGSTRNCPPIVEQELEGNQFENIHHFQYTIDHEHRHGHVHSKSKKNKPGRYVPDRPIIFPGDLRFLNETKREMPMTASASQSQPVAVNLASIMRPTPLVPMNSPDCGISLKMRILGGQDADPAQFPWLARIGYRNRTSNRISYRCSGTLISKNPTYVVTAAHCVVNLVNELELSHVRIGADASSPNDCVFNAINCTKPNLFEINQLIVHPEYDQPRYANDIALLRITNTLINITAICLPLDNTATIANRLIGQLGVAAGWSSTNTEADGSIAKGSNQNSSSVRFISLPIVNTTTCAIAYATLSENFQEPIVITPNHLCAQGQPMNDVCRGDSGGPFMDNGLSGVISSDQRYTLLGIVSFGPTLCGVTTIPGVYTRVSAYISWIFRSMRAG